MAAVAEMALKDQVEVLEERVQELEAAREADAEAKRQWEKKVNKGIKIGTYCFLSFIVGIIFRSAIGP